MTSIPVFPQGEMDGIHGQLWRQWNHVLHGLPVDKFSAWKVMSSSPSSSGSRDNNGGDATSQQPLQILAFVLNSFDDFDRWLTRENAQDGLYYRKVAQSMREKQGAEYLMYHCHKSGKARLKADGERKRKPRETATKKLGFICSSKIVVRRHTKDGLVSWKKLSGRQDAQGCPLDIDRVPVAAGQVSVVYTYTHSHPITERDVRDTPISEHTRRLIKVWRALGFSVDEIYDNLMAARSDDASQAEAVGIAIPTTREAHISKRDLRNILVAAGMYKRENLTMMHHFSTNHPHAAMALNGESMPLTESDYRSADLLVSELRDKYGTGDDPVPPPFWGSQLIEEDARSARLMIDLFTNLHDAAKNLNDLGLLTGKQEMYLPLKQRLDQIRLSTLMTTSRRLLFPNYTTTTGVVNTATTGGGAIVGQMITGEMPSSTEEELTDASTFMIGATTNTVAEEDMGKPASMAHSQEQHYVV